MNLCALHKLPAMLGGQSVTLAVSQHVVPEHTDLAEVVLIGELERPTSPDALSECSKSFL